ncbi:bursicon [Hetaerina americana]|uniref:bursicon n=1 Tax=Hetaerina americana TaxID=62018 RepID=UPI003A7F502E
MESGLPMGRVGVSGPSGREGPHAGAPCRKGAVPHPFPLLLLLLLAALWLPGGVRALSDQCQVTPVIHVLQYPGCVPKPIPSFACTGRCTSYLQVSGSKIWQMERSCMCCQESGEREASVSLFCPKAKPGERKFRKVTTKAPLECMCRPCTGVEESAVVPQEIAAYADEGTLSSHFRRTQ